MQLKAHCDHRISYHHTSFISQVHSKTVLSSAEVSFIFINGINYNKIRDLSLVKKHQQKNRLLLDTESLKARIISFRNLESQYTCTKSGSSNYGPTNYGKTGKVILRQFSRHKKK